MEDRRNRSRNKGTESAGITIRLAGQQQLLTLYLIHAYFKSRKLKISQSEAIGDQL